MPFLRAALPALAGLLIVVGAALLLGPADARSAGSWTWPVEGEVLTSYRNGDDPYARGQHRGIDIAAGVGTPAVAAIAGTVRFRGVAGSNGLTVSIRTMDGRFDTSYLHLASASVEKGQVVQAGERVGTVGESGRRSAGAPHLHFGVREAGSRHAYVDPLTVLGPLPRPVPAEPRGAPVPVKEPVPVSPVPAPVPAPVALPIRSPSPSPSPVRVPAGRRVRVPVGRRVRVPGTRRIPWGRPAPARVGVPVADGQAAPAPSLQPLGALDRGAALGPRERPAASLGSPSVGPGAGAVVAPHRPPAVAAATPAGIRPDVAEPQPSSSKGRSPDVGWAIACVGLLLAAACIGGRPGGNQERQGARRSALRDLLRPLTGGR